MNRSRAAVGVAGVLALATLAACSPAPSPLPRGTERPVVESTSAPTPPDDTEPTAGPAAVLARADRVLELPDSTTSMADLPFVGPAQELPGPVVGISSDGDPMVQADGDWARPLRVPLDGPPVAIANYHDVGPATRPNGGASYPVAAADVMAWLAYHDGRDDLNIADFTVYAAASDGREAREIGRSTADVPDQGTGRNIQVPFWRERLMVMGARAYWMERVRRVGDVDTLPDFAEGDELGTAVMSAPLTGDGPQVETADGWYHGEDLCGPLGSSVLVYLDSALSQATDSGTASLRRAVVDAQGSIEREDVLWSAPEDDGYVVNGAAACGDTVAVAWQHTARAAAVEVRHDERTTVVVLPDEAYATQPVVTDRAVFFATVNGEVDGGLFVLDLASGELSRTFLEAGFYDTLHVSRQVLAWLESSELTDDLEHDQLYLAAPFDG